jgi:hypothetical protein
VSERALAGSRRDEERTKGSLLGGPSDKVGQTVIAQWSRIPANKRARGSRYGAETIGCHEWNEQQTRAVASSQTHSDELTQVLEWVQGEVQEGKSEDEELQLAAGGA